jgi:hypothetical protein
MAVANGLRGPAWASPPHLWFGVQCSAPRSEERPQDLASPDLRAARVGGVPPAPSCQHRSSGRISNRPSSSGHLEVSVHGLGALAGRPPAQDTPKLVCVSGTGDGHVAEAGWGWRGAVLARRSAGGIALLTCERAAWWCACLTGIKACRRGLHASGGRQARGTGVRGMAGLERACHVTAARR